MANNSNSANTNLYNPGESGAPAGTYQEVGPRGGKVENGRTASISRGDRLPPVSTAGNKWEKQ